MKTLIHDHYYALAGDMGFSFGVYMGQYGDMHMFESVMFCTDVGMLRGGFTSDELSGMSLFYLGALGGRPTETAARDALKLHRK